MICYLCNKDHLTSECPIQRNQRDALSDSERLDRDLVTDVCTSIEKILGEVLISRKYSSVEAPEIWTIARAFVGIRDLPDTTFQDAYQATLNSFGRKSS